MRLRQDNLAEWPSNWARDADQPRMTALGVASGVGCAMAVSRFGQFNGPAPGADTVLNPPVKITTRSGNSFSGRIGMLFLA